MSHALAPLALAVAIPALALSPRTPASSRTQSTSSPTPHSPNPSQPCATVRARYSIYVDGDRLWVVGSKHFLDVASDDLDRQLRDRDWTKTVVFGNFTLCAPNLTDPKQLTIHDHVTLQSYTDLQFRPR